MSALVPPRYTGLAAMIAASSIWGSSSMFFRFLGAVPPLEMLAHRSLWSLVFFLGVLALQGRLGALRAALCRPRVLALVAAAAAAVSVNWFAFILSVDLGRALEASFGYFILPLVSVGFGVAIFGERLGRVQIVAVAVAALGVLVLALGLGVAPWIAVVLALSFGIYGTVKKLIPLDPLLSTAAEVVILAPFALVWLVGVHALGWTGPTGRSGGIFGQAWLPSLLLILSGPLTGVPLMLFSLATKHVRMTTIGLLQYINPTLQFIVAVAVFGERFTRWHGIAFALIWAALVIWTVAGLRKRGRTAAA